MQTILRLAGYALLAGMLVGGCGGAEAPPEEPEAPNSDELVPLHHNSPVYEQVDDLVSENHNEAIEEMLDRMADIDQTVNQDGAMGTTSDTGDATTALTQDGGGANYDGDDFMTQPNENAEESFDAVDAMLDENVPTETQDGTISGDTTSARTGEDALP